MIAGLKTLVGTSISLCAAEGSENRNHFLAAPQSDAANDMPCAAALQNFRTSGSIAVGIALRIVFHRRKQGRNGRIAIDVRDCRQGSRPTRIGHEPIVAGTRVQNTDFDAAFQTIPPKRKCPAATHMKARLTRHLCRSANRADILSGRQSNRTIQSGGKQFDRRFRLLCASDGSVRIPNRAEYRIPNTAPAAGRSEPFPRRPIQFVRPELP